MVTLVIACLCLQTTAAPPPSAVSANAASLNNGELAQPTAVAYSRTPQDPSDASAEEKITLLGTNTLSASAAAAASAASKSSDAADPSS